MTYIRSSVRTVRRRLKMTDYPYEYYVPLVKKRDEKECQGEGCTRKPNEKMLRVVRRDPYKADSMENLVTVCKWCAPDYE